MRTRRRLTVSAICAAVLVFEGLVVVLRDRWWRSTSATSTTPPLWWVGGVGAGRCASLLAGLLRRRWACAAGSVLQVLIVGTGVVVPTMFFLGALFAGLWFLAIFLGRRVERLQAAAAAEPTIARLRRERAAGSPSDTARRARPTSASEEDA